MLRGVYVYGCGDLSSLLCIVLYVCSVRYAVTLWFFDTEERKLAEAAEQDAS
jgi:hypothetical protein